jgi:hypothetical protein
MRNLLAAFVLVSLSTLPANAQAWRNCVQGSIGPGGCDSIGPGGGKSIGPGGGQSIGRVADCRLVPVVVSRLDPVADYQSLRMEAWGLTGIGVAGLTQGPLIATGTDSQASPTVA